MTGSTARNYLRARDAGVLATLSAKLGGYPFGSVITYATDHAACPVILVSGLAEHTKNMRADPRVSLLVRDTTADPQSSARLTLVGDAMPFTPEAALRERLLRLEPAWTELLDLGDFGFFRIAPKTLRFIEGFGSIRWVRPEDFAPPENAIAALEAEAIAHMNDDHAEALRTLAGGVAATVVGIDCDGFDLRVEGERRRIEFDAPVGDAGALRATLAGMTRRARGS